MNSPLKKLITNRYPLLVIIAIPLLMSFGTYWNLRSFNRDMNLLVRRHATSLAESVSPFISKDIDNIQFVTEELLLMQNSNDEIYSANVLKKEGEEFTLYSSTNRETSGDLADLGLNQLAIGFSRPVAGLVYDANLGGNVWNVVVPIKDTNNYLFVLRLKTDSVESLLSRTARDSLIILVIIIIATIILFINHLVFYRRSLETTKLKELDKLKDEFISMAAHELQAPVTGLVGYLDIVKLNISNNNISEIKENISILDSLTDNLGNLIQDLLSVSRIEQGRIEITKKQFSLDVLVKEITDTYKIQADKKQLTLELNISQIQPINSDEDRLRQVISNLISNAIKYTNEGSVKVSLTQNSKNVEIKVEDTGVGIPPKHMEKMFTKFFRVKDNKTSKVPGTGLGLWISKQIIELLGGELLIESIHGTGSVFTITLPIK